MKYHVILLLLVLLAPWANAKSAAVVQAAEGRISIRVQPAAARVGPGEELEFIIMFRNNSAEPIQLPITKYLDTLTLGVYRYEISNVHHHDQWRVSADPEAQLPAETPTAEPVVLQPNDVYVTRIKLPGVGRQFVQVQTDEEIDETETSTARMPTGEYELTLTMVLPGEKLVAGPVDFAISDTIAKPSKSESPPKKVSAAASRFLKERLDLYRKANVGEEPWKSLAEGSFVSSAKRDDETDWRFEYLAELPKQRQVVRLEVVVNQAGKIISPDAGFTVMSAQRGRRN